MEDMPSTLMKNIKERGIYLINLISMIEPGWKEKGIKNYKKVKEFLEGNKRHSYIDYIGKKNFHSVTEREFLSELMGGIVGCKDAVNNWIIHKEEVKKLSDLLELYDV